MKRRGLRRNVIENLEDRVLLTVKLQFNSGKEQLTIKGTKASDTVVLDGSGTTGGVDAFVNGAFFQHYDNVRNIVANFKGGDDRFDLGAVQIAGSVSVKMGSGTDVMNADTITHLGTGPNGIIRIVGSVDVDMGNNAGDKIFWNTLSGFGMLISGPTSLKGAADVRLDGSGGSFIAEAGDITFESSLKIALSSFGDTDSDGFNCFFDNVNISGTTEILATGANDSISIGDTSVLDTTTIVLGSGTNLVDVDVPSRANYFRGLVTYDGQGGTDTLDDNTSTNLYATGRKLLQIETEI
ncbi:MAG: hypothetical protein KDA36_01360 [Planctomycetaceae bacterium]|nr:hypothetical protein [Planctomycetaceae bacterium]